MKKIEPDYEDDEYEVRLKEGGYVSRKNDMLKPWYDYEREEGEYFLAHMRIMIVKNKKTGKTSTKQVYQDDAIEDFINDLECKSQFSDIFKKIDN